jgi:phage terminase large subunit GpA-like protein
MSTNTPIFEQMKRGLLNIDPVAFCETYLTLDGAPFRVNGNGYKPFSDIYRYIGIKALEKDAKPVVIVKGRQVGATTMAAALELFFTCSAIFGRNKRPPMRIMHCFPLLEMGYRYTKQKLNTMIRGAVADTTPNKHNKIKTYVENKLDKTSTANDSISFKQFENGNLILIESTGQTAERLRGITADIEFFDECQMIPAHALSNAVKSLTKAQYGPSGMGVQVYFGTPLQKGTGFHKLWNVSSKQYFHLGCEQCGDTFQLYTPESDDWMNIWIADDLSPKDPKHGFIVKCPHCGKEQDKREAAERGKWVSSNSEEDCQYVGFHLNQLYMPTLNRDYIISQRPENHPYMTERAYQNEVMG